MPSRKNFLRWARETDAGDDLAAQQDFVQEIVNNQTFVIIYSAVVRNAWWKIAGESEPASYNFTYSSSLVGFGGMLAYSGNYLTPILAQAGTANHNSASMPAPSVSPSLAGLLICGWYTSNSWSEGPITKPASMTQRINIYNAGQAAGQRAFVLADEAVAAGATGTRTATQGFANNGGSWSVAIAERLPGGRSSIVVV